MLSAQIHKQAALLAREHRKSDPDIVAIYVDPGTDAVRMVEVSRSVGTTGEVIPFRFTGGIEADLPLDTVLVLVSEEELRLLQSGELDLPHDWHAIENLTELDLEDPDE